MPVQHARKPETIHLRPPIAATSRTEYRAGHAYCGRKARDLTTDRSLATCIDCQAAHAADQEGDG